jgi:iron complex outermembrane receptor protein
MEERSPGSYRLSIRGSLLRSPFGVRNIKVYFDEFPLTNGGGETYLNLIDPNSIYSMEILRGPDGSLFGANSGGVLRIEPENTRADTGMFHLSTAAGSYGLFQENFQFRKKGGKNIFSFKQGFQKSDGYREHSGMNRKYFQASNRYLYSERGQIRAVFFYSDLAYDTPGGLTQAQFEKILAPPVRPLLHFRALLRRTPP